MLSAWGTTTAKMSPVSLIVALSVAPVGVMTETDGATLKSGGVVSVASVVKVALDTTVESFPEASCCW